MTELSLAAASTRQLVLLVLTRLEELETLIVATQEDVNALAGRLNDARLEVLAAVSGIRADLDELKAANPALDLTALDASVGRIEAAADAVSGLDAENPPPAPTP